MAHRFTVGVEEEFQIVDPETWELRSHVSELLASSASLGDQIKRELHQSIGEREELGYGERARDIAAELAAHFEQAGADRRAVRYLTDAADTATRRNAPAARLA